MTRAGMVLAAAILAAPAAAAPGPADLYRYRGIQDERFLRHWLLAGPIPVETVPEAPPATVLHAALDADLLRGEAGGERAVRPRRRFGFTAGDVTVGWIPVSAWNDTVDVADQIGARDDAAAYAWVSVEVPVSVSCWLAVGSDDAVKVWINGEVVLAHDVLRKFTPDEDIVPVVLRAGTNEMLLKVLNASGGWYYSARFLGPGAALRAAARTGNLTLLDHALARGAGPAATDDRGWTALHHAAYAGREEAVTRLLDRGASPDPRTPDGLTPLHAARRVGRKGVADRLVARGADPTAEPRPLAEQMDAVCAFMTRGRRPGAAVLVTRDGAVLHAKGYGRARLAGEAPVTAETRFNLASLSKPFTAACVQMLAADGRLSLDDPVARHLPECAGLGDAVTLRRLLTHTAGLPRNLEAEDGRKLASLRDYLAAVPFDAGVRFDPGTRDVYSNYGYELLAAVVARVSGLRYPEFVAARIFRPLGMTRSVVNDPDRPVPGARAAGYRRNGDGWAVLDFGERAYNMGAGGIFTTVHDLARWDRALARGTLLPAAALAEAWTSATLADGSRTGYGLGWHVAEHRGLKEASHDGRDYGFRTCIRRFLDERVTVAVLANWVECDVWRLTADLAEVVLSDRMTPR